MSKMYQVPHQIPTGSRPQAVNEEVSRRSLLKAGIVGAGVAAVPTVVSACTFRNFLCVSG